MSHAGFRGMDISVDGGSAIAARQWKERLIKWLRGGGCGDSRVRQESFRRLGHEQRGLVLQELPEGGKRRCGPH